MSIPVKQNEYYSEIMEGVLMKGDLSKLTPAERTTYYQEVCKSLGLNPLTKPFEYITLNGRLTLYALRAATDQLRKINGISLEIVSKEAADDILTVHVRARTPEGRCDEDLGAVAFPSTLKGEARANAELKCVTKAKRRATLSICGLGWMDETEVDDIPASRKAPPPAPNVMKSVEPPHDEKTGEVIDIIEQSEEGDGAEEEGTRAMPFEAMAREAAQRGQDIFKTFYAGCTREQKVFLRGMKPELEKLFPAEA